MYKCIEYEQTFLSSWHKSSTDHRNGCTEYCENQHFLTTEPIDRDGRHEICWDGDDAC